MRKVTYAFASLSFCLALVACGKPKEATTMVDGMVGRDVTSTELPGMLGIFEGPAGSLRINSDGKFVLETVNEEVRWYENKIVDGHSTSSEQHVATCSIRRTGSLKIIEVDSDHRKLVQASFTGRELVKAVKTNRGNGAKYDPTEVCNYVIELYSRENAVLTNQLVARGSNHFWLSRQQNGFGALEENARVFINTETSNYLNADSSFNGAAGVFVRQGEEVDVTEMLSPVLKSEFVPYSDSYKGYTLKVDPTFHRLHYSSPEKIEGNEYRWCLINFDALYRVVARGQHVYVQVSAVDASSASPSPANSREGVCADLLKVIVAEKNLELFEINGSGALLSTKSAEHQLMSFYPKRK